MQTENQPAQKKTGNYLKKIGRILLKTILYIFLFIILVFLLILTPPVQRFLTSKVQTYLQNKLHTRVDIGAITFGLSGKINLKNIYIEDQTKDTLLAGGAIKAHLDFLKLLSHEVQVKDIELQNITAKIKRVLPDTVFNFQFIVNAFTSGQTQKTDTTNAPPLKLNISDVALDNVNLTYKDVITGNDLFAHIGTLSATIDSLDPYLPKVALPTLIVRNVRARMLQSKPLVTPQPAAVDTAKASEPIAMQFSFGTIDLNKIAIDYGNDVSAMYTNFNIGRLKIDGKLIDLQNRKIYLEQIALNNSKSVIRFGKAPMAAATAKEVSQKVQAQTAQPWDFRIAHIRIDNNTLKYDNDNNPKQPYGLDYAHILGDSVTLHADNVVFQPDSMAALITEGHLNERSGLRLQALEGDVLYSNKETYIRNLYIKTPGTEIRRNVTLRYPSLEAMTKNPSATAFDIQLVNSHVQVKDILAFVPQLRTNPAFRNPYDVWNFNIVGNGTLNQLYFKTLQFDGLRNTQLNASGTIAGATNPNTASGNFTIYRFHTTQSDIASITGQNLASGQMNLPQSIDVSGTVSGSMARLQTNLNVSTSEGFLGLNGSFANLTRPDAASYNATIRANNLQVGNILKKQDQIGSLTAVFHINGNGLSPNTMNTRFNGTVLSLGYNHYQYHNVNINGTLKRTVFSVTTNVNDPNIDLDLTASGDYGSAHPYYKINGMIDSIKTLPLHLTPQAIEFRGRIDGAVTNITPENINANVLLTNALFVSDTNRIAMDTVQLQSGRNDTAQFIKLRSDIANALITGHYRITDFGTIIQNTITPYFASSPAQPKATVQPYDVQFRIDVVYDPIIASFVPSLTAMQPLHMEGRLATNAGLQALITSPYIQYGTNELSNLNVRISTADSLRATLVAGHLKSGNSFDVYNARIYASALNNNINFSLGIDDKSGRNKYFLSGLFTQPSAGTYAVSLNPGNLLLNYQTWTVAGDNKIIISPSAISVTDFVLRQAAQSLSINSAPGTGQQPINVTFTNFRLATITGFIKSDSLLADGLINGTASFRNIMQQPLFTSDLTISNLTMRQDTIGNVGIRVSNTTSNVYNANITITGQGNDVLLSGSVAQLTGGDLGLDLNLAIRQIQLHSLQGALQSAIYNASGSINGNVRITGTSAKPSILGQINFDTASFALAMLGSQFRLRHETITVNNSGLQFNHFTIRDSANNALDINGAVTTTNFVNYGFDLTINSRNFEVLNSTREQNKVYFGKLFISTNLHITGTETKPTVMGAVFIGDSTNLTVVMPQQDPGVVSRAGIVQFVDFSSGKNDSLFMAPYDSMKQANNVLGLNLSVNIVIRKGATMNLIVDEANGDFVNIQGQGQLSAGIDPSGKISLTGRYEITNGYYQLSFNFLQRKFEIQKGSTITWLGDPTSAQLNITAVYIANTAPLDLVQDQLPPSAGNRNIYLQKLPFQVHLILTGMLMKPNIAFDIVLPNNQDYGVSRTVTDAVRTRLDQLRQEPGETNKQVFALLLLGRFVGQNPFQSSGGGGGINSMVAQSVSKLLTEQLNNLASNLINGVDINFNVTSTDDYTTGSLRNRTDLNVGLSKRLLNNRLTVAVGSNFELQGPRQTNQQANNIAGNIAINYQLSKDGRYMIRLYRKNNYEEDLEGYVIETGVGFIISMDYNQFADILRKKRARASENKGDIKTSNQ